jgi:putative ABC transport system permease protein
MLLNYFKIAIRNIRRSASSTLINVSGLALGITCGLLIFSIVQYHLSFDNFHKSGDRIYRFVTEQHRDQVSYVPSVPPAFGIAFRNDFTFGEKVARLCTTYDHQITLDEGSGSKKFRENISFAEPEFFEIFNFPFIAGQEKNILAEPNTAIITDRIARKYYGDESPLNKTFRLNNSIEFKIVGVLKDIPENTDFRSEIYFSFSTIGQYNEWYGKEDSWGGITSEIQSFARLQPGVVASEVESVLPAYVKKYRAESKNVHHYKLQPLDDVHFNSRYQGRMSKTTIWVLSLIGVFLIITACVNFINLATAQAIGRSREVGVRKALGSMRGQLFLQFTIETAVIVLMSSVMAFCIAYASLPYVNTWFDTRVTLDFFSNPSLAVFMAALAVLVTFFSCSYPGLILSGFRPVEALKGKLADYRNSNFSLRRGLIVTQFTIAQILLIGLLVIAFQMKHFMQTDMGFDQDAIVMIPIGSQDIKMKTLKEQFQQIPNVEDVSICFSAPASNSHWGSSITYDNRTEMEDFGVSIKSADENFVSTFGIEIVAGRNLQPSDSVREILVNKILVSKLNLSSPEEILGKTILTNGKQAPVVGVISDFHDQSFRSAISPVLITTSTENYHEYGVKINMQEAPATLAALEKTWTSMYPDQIYEYEFLDQQTAQFYEAEQTILKLIQVFSLIALIIGCLGLYGLVSYMAVQKTKEIGIRKVLGGTVANILWIFGKELFLLILIAFALAAPIGWWIMFKWLQNYEYRFNITWWIFAIEAAIILVVALLTVGFRSAKAAMMNPANALRTE